MKYFFFSKVVERGSPIFLNGLLHEKYDKSLVDAAPMYSWHWVEPGCSLTQLPRSLTLITKDPLINFDIRNGQQAGDFYISNELFSAIESMVRFEFEIAALQVVGIDGSPRAERNFSYIRFVSNHRIKREFIDFEKSHIEFRKSGEIKRISALAFSKSLTDYLFMINELKIFRHLFVSANLARMLSAKKWCGFSLCATEAIGYHERV
jgi:hypothetical protein